jgi:hypothetical protein
VPVQKATSSSISGTVLLNKVILCICLNRDVFSKGGGKKTITHILAYMQEIVSNGGLVKLEDIAGVGTRITPSGHVNPPLAVSMARGLATVCAEQRITVYDLVDAEDGDDDDDEEEEGEEEGGEELDDQESGLSGQSEGYVHVDKM